MKYKGNWDEARERLSRLWHGDRLDRPVICITAPSGAGVRGPKPASAEDKWLGKDTIRESFAANLANTWWGGESIPSLILMAGWIVCFGGDVGFAPETIWYEHKDYDFDSPPDLRFDPEDRWTRRFIDLYVAVAEMAGRDDFLVGKPALLPANDILSMQMGTENFLLALYDHPDWMREAIAMGGRAQIAARRHIQGLIKGTHDFWYGNAGWMRFWAPEEFVSTQSDVSCMLSPAQFDAFVRPELVDYGESAGALWYHLDGSNAKQHLPSLLGIECLRVVQYVAAPWEPRNGIEHLAMYRQIQEAGRIVHIGIAPGDIEPLLRCKQLDPTRFILETWQDSPKAGMELLEAATRWSTR